MLTDVGKDPCARWTRPIVIRGPDSVWVSVEDAGSWPALDPARAGISGGRVELNVGEWRGPASAGSSACQEDEEGGGRPNSSLASRGQVGDPAVLAGHDPICWEEGNASKAMQLQWVGRDATKEADGRHW